MHHNRPSQSDIDARDTVSRKVAVTEAHMIIIYLMIELEGAC